METLTENNKASKRDSYQSLKQRMEAFAQTLSESDRQALIASYDQGIKELVGSYESQLAKLVIEQADLKQETESLWEKLKTIEDYHQRMELSERRGKISRQVTAIDKDINNLRNLISCVQSGGEIIQFEDKLGTINTKLPDFRNIETQVVAFNEDTLLDEPIPKFIPIIDEEVFKQLGYIINAIRLEKNTYIMALGAYDHKAKEENPNRYALLTLDQLVLVNQYYYTKARAEKVKKADDYTRRSQEQYDKLPRERRERFLNQKNYYSALPVAVKKKITQEDYEMLSLEEKEQVYKPFKRYRPEKLKSKLEEGYMWASFHSMYQRFVNPQAYVTDKNGVPQPDAMPSMAYRANIEVSKYWAIFKEMLEFKLKDIKEEIIYQNEAYKTAFETSFGESNTSDDLLSEYGILVKRQNGDQINANEINQIREGFNAIQKVFGNLKEIAFKKGLKISHTGKKLVFSQKAIGLYFSRMGTISASDKYGDMMFQSVLSHELAHFIDNYIGSLSGKGYETDDYEGTAGILAFTFRNNMNLDKRLQNDYINSTKECFARALQQYFCIETFGDEAGILFSERELDKEIPIFIQENFVNKDKYKTLIRPLIEKFFYENSDIFKFTIDVDNSTANVPIGSEQLTQDQVNPQEIQEALQSLEVLYEISDEIDKPDIKDAIEVLKLLI